MANVKLPSGKTKVTEKDRTAITKSAKESIAPSKVPDTLTNEQPTIIDGPPLVLPPLLTGLGTRYYETMEKNKEKIHHVSTLHLTQLLP